MRLYTSREILEDIEKFEKVSLSFMGTHSLLGDHSPDVRFVVPYSEFYDRPLSGSATVDMLKNRISQFMESQNNMLPHCDVWPTSEYGYWHYAMLWPENTPFLMDVEMTLLGKTNSQEESLEFIKTESVKEQTRKLCIVSTKTREILFFNRIDH